MAAAQIVAKAAEIDPERSLEFVKELSLSGWELTNSLRGYVQATARDGRWREVIGQLEYFENYRDASAGPRALSPGTENMIATEWVREDFEEGMRWFTGEIKRDYSNPKDVKNVASVLAGIPEEEQYQVLDWVQTQREKSGWHDGVVMALGKTLVVAGPTANTERLVGLISSEGDRFEFVTQFIGSSTPHHLDKLRHSPESLNRLVEAARLTEANTARLKEVIAGAKWTGS
ncbi:hypothetical protein N9A94_04270 [Akkermansiaceae bacterium]|nr:hypothetical protein [Akkermansiaceae bacterium]